MHGNDPRFGHDTTSRATTSPTVDSYARMRAVKRRQHEPPAGQVVAPLQQQQRALTEDRQQRDRPADRHAVLGIGVQGPGRLGIPKHHQRLLKPTNRTLNVSPNRRRENSKKEIGRSNQRSVCWIGGSLGPTGRGCAMSGVRSCVRPDGHRLRRQRALPDSNGRPFRCPAGRGCKRRMDRGPWPHLKDTTLRSSGISALLSALPANGSTSNGVVVFS